MLACYPPVPHSYAGSRRKRSVSGRSSKRTTYIESDSDSDFESCVEIERPHIAGSRNRPVCKNKKDLTTYEGRTNFLKKYMTVTDDNKYQSKDLTKFLNPKEPHEVKLTSDGKVVISGFKFSVPDLAAEYKKEYEDNLKLIEQINCDRKSSVRKWNQISTVINGILFAVILVLFIVFCIFRYWTSEN